VVPPEPATSAPLLRVGRYEVISHLATGGMAQIYLARQTGLGSFERHVVLKTIVRERASDQRFVTMFLDEAKLAATLNHQNVAQVYEVDHADGAYFMAMEYVHGENARAILETTVRRGWTIPLELAVMMINGAAAGLHHAHERRGKGGQPLNIVHRDVSPANIMVGYDGSVKMLDFGIAKAEERATKTVGGTIKGKYGYMAPEQCKGKAIDRRSDIFALGIVLYELTTLRRAFKGKDDFETMKKIVAGEYVPPSEVVPGYPPGLEVIVQTALALEPAARFQTAQELNEALDAFAVREKLTGTNTALGRFMVQLFGTKKEPWITGGAEESTAVGDPPVDGERTTVGDPAVVAALQAAGESDPDGDEMMDEEAQTILVGPRAAASRLATAMGVGEPPRPPADAAAWAEASHAARRSSQRHVAVPDGGSGTGAPLQRLTPPAMAQAAPLQRTTPPSMAQAAPPQRMTPPSMAQAVPPQRMTPPAMAQAVPRTSATPPRPVPLVPAPPVFRPAPMPSSGSIPLPSLDDMSELGAKPLLDDPKLGWETSPGSRMLPQQPSQHDQPIGTRLASEGSDYKIKSNVWWLVLALVIVLGVTAAVVVIATST
jgi:eukaryotic-like serine/threonine-protein kinase